MNARHFALHVALALGWAAALGAFTPSGLALGFVVGYAALRAAGLFLPFGGYLRAVERLALGVPFLAWEMVRANLRLAWEILTPGFSMHAAFVACPVGGLTRAEKTVVAFVTTLTPGTMSVDFSPDGDTLYIHAMYAKDPERVRADVRNVARRLFGKEGA